MVGLTAVFLRKSVAILYASNQWISDDFLFPQDMHINKNEIMNSMTESKQTVCTIY